MNCSINIKPKLNQFDRTTRFVDKIKINNQEFIVKKEIIIKENMLEYKFFINNVSPYFILN